jgi:hypothetical protein
MKTKLRFAYGMEDRARVTRQLIEDVLGPVAYRSGLRRAARHPESDPRDDLIVKLERDLKALQDRYATVDRARQVAVKKLKSLKGGNGGGESELSVEGLFLDTEDQFRFEVDLEWALRIPAADKPKRSLAGYMIGPAFLASLDEVKGVNRAKVVSVVVEVLTGLAMELPGRDLHPLRVSEVGVAAAVTRADGATCWRVALQQSTPQAARLHFWRLGEWHELSRVVRHDDFRP